MSDNAAPRWAPDGRVTYVSDRSGSWGVWTRNADGTAEPSRLYEHTGPGNVAEAFLSPDGEWLLFRLGGAQRLRDVLALRLGVDSVPRPLLAGPYEETGAALSPDGRWLATAARDFKGDDVVIAPVPLHWRRLLERRYNQAAVLAEGLHRIWGCGRLQPDLLQRRLWRGSQGGLSAAQRRRNVRNAFAVTARRRPLVEGRRVVLVDDVMASGATADGAARTLKGAGAGAVDVVVLARVLNSVG